MIDPAERPTHLCPHIVADKDDYHVWFTGVGQAMYWVCADCAKAHPEPPAALVEYTPAFWAAREDALCWDGICGAPEVRERPSTLRFEHADFARPAVDAWIDVQPKPGGVEWWVLRADGLAIWSPDANTLTAALDLADLDFEIDAETGLRVSPDGRYAAVFQTSAQLARVYDLATGAQTAQIDRGDYRPENTHFPLTFFMADDRCLLVAATAWNRLDIHDPATGAVLTERADPDDADASSTRFLNYFRGRLTASPNGRRIVDRGWVWHPVGVVRTWDLRAWLETNPWESERSPSLRDLTARDYFWDGPACWIDDHTVVVWGWGRDDEWLVPAALLYEAQTGDLQRWFAGPQVRQPGAWPPKKQPPSLFFDAWLFSVSDTAGVSVWDVATGERVCSDAHLKPIHYHPDAKRFISLTGAGVRLSQLVD